jgi:hypothetical protein
MNPNRSLHKLLRIIFSEVLMEYFDISGWHDDSSKIEVWLDEKNYRSVVILGGLIFVNFSLCIHLC